MFVRQIWSHSQQTGISRWGPLRPASWTKWGPPYVSLDLAIGLTTFLLEFLVGKWGSFSTRGGLICPQPDTIDSENITWKQKKSHAETLSHSAKWTLRQPENLGNWMLWWISMHSYSAFQVSNHASSWRLAIYWRVYPQIFVQVSCAEADDHLEVLLQSFFKIASLLGRQDRKLFLQKPLPR